MMLGKDGLYNKLASGNWVYMLKIKVDTYLTLCILNQRCSKS